MIEIYNSQSVPVHERFEHWRNVLCNCNVLLDANRSVDNHTPFSAVLGGAVFGQILLHRWQYRSSCSQDFITVDRRENHIANDAYDAYLLAYNTGVEGAVIQNNKEVVVPHNYFCLYTTQPYRTLTRSNASGFFISIPRHYLQHLLAKPDVLGVRLVPADYGAARLLLAFCKELPKLINELPPGCSEIIALQFSSLVALAFEPNDNGIQHAEPTLAEMRYRSIVNYIDDNLEDPALTANMVAIALKISPGYLSRLLAEHDTSFQDYVRLNRVRKSARDMENPEFARLSITDIAYKNGFSSMSHFSRCFRERFHLSPREYRLQFNHKEGVQA